MNTAKIFLVIPNKPLKMHLKLSQKQEFETAKATGDLIGSEIPDAVAKSWDGKITKVLKTSPQNSSEMNIKSEHDKNNDMRSSEMIWDDLLMIWD